MAKINLYSKEQTDAKLADKANAADVTAALLAKQDTLVAGTNIKTINGNSLLGSGDMVISGGGATVTLTDNTTYWTLSVQ